jgi:RNA polymerase sigma-70 factor, ECF subfamily
MEIARAQNDSVASLLALYDDALPEVYGYLLRRTGSQVVAEDVAADTFFAALHSAQTNVVHQVTVAWLIGIARHRLIDHWRKVAHDTRLLEAVQGDVGGTTTGDIHYDVDEPTAVALLRNLPPDHRTVLTLRYLDGLSVKEIADAIDRTVHATESLLQRAKKSYRAEIESRGDHV